MNSELWDLLSPLFSDVETRIKGFSASRATSEEIYLYHLYKRLVQMELELANEIGPILNGAHDERAGYKINDAFIRYCVGFSKEMDKSEKVCGLSNPFDIAAIIRESEEMTWFRMQSIVLGALMYREALVRAVILHKPFENPSAIFGSPSGKLPFEREFWLERTEKEVVDLRHHIMLQNAKREELLDQPSALLIEFKSKRA